MAISKAEYLQRLQETYLDRPALWEVELAAAEQRGDFASQPAPAQPAPEGGDAGE